MRKKIMIYGAYGYTGRLVSERAAALGLDVSLAGRNPERLADVARPLKLDHQALDLDDTGLLETALAGVSVVIHCAGPFAVTSRPMLAACLNTGTHYLDITGEVGVLAACAGLSGKAKAAGITVMPGCGFDVVPTDCMALMLSERLPDANRLELAFAGLERASQGTMRTAAMFIAAPVFHRKGGTLVPRQGSPTKMIDFGAGPERAFATTWGDIETAAHTTGIENIDVFMKPAKEMEATMRLPAFLRRLMATRLGGWLIQARINRLPAGPDQAERRRGRAIVTGQVWNPSGDSVSLRMRTAEPYALTAMTAVEIAQRVAAGNVPHGFQTPAGAFGADFILGFDGSEMIG